jgi:hypothetical protein
LAPLVKLRRVGQKLFERFRLEFVAIGCFLAANAELRPRHRIQALGLDFLFTMKANPIAAICDAPERASHISQKAGFPVQVADGQLALPGELYFVQGIWSFFNGDIFAVAQSGGKLGFFGFQDCSVFVGSFSFSQFFIFYISCF